MSEKEAQLVDKVLACVALELAQAMKPYGRSTYEGCAVTLEELDELWTEIKKKCPDQTKLIEGAVQITAAAVHFTISRELAEREGATQWE